MSATATTGFGESDVIDRQMVADAAVGSAFSPLNRSRTKGVR